MTVGLPTGWRLRFVDGVWAAHRLASDEHTGSLIFADDPEDSPWLGDPDKRAAWQALRALVVHMRSS